MSELALKLIEKNKELYKFDPNKAKFLDLGNCGLRKLPLELFNCIWLEKLSLGSFYIKIEDNKLMQYYSVENKGSLNSFNAKELNNLQKLPNLTSLHLCFTQINSYSFLEKLTNLNSLYLSSSKISDIRFLENLTNLNSLTLNSNKISDISFLEKLTNLNSLHLGSNQIRDISFLEKLPNLNSLYLESNQVKDFSFLEKLTNLTALNLELNQIYDIRFLENLTNLNFLDLENNLISEAQHLEKLINLNSLNLRSNLIKDLCFLENLTNLNSLDLGSNQISDIRFLKKLTNLNSLYLDSNQISNIRFLEKLPNLDSLVLRRNQISDIHFLEKLTNLNSLDLSFNQISNIKALLPLFKKGGEISLKLIDFERKINLMDNVITNPPIEIVKQGREAIIEYFEGKLRPLNECKLIFVGDGGVGKTSLMRRLVSDSFEEAEKTTHGINKIAWEEINNNESEKIRVNLWDFGGQHIQHSLHQFFFSERVIYVLVLNPRNDQKADYWLDQIEKLGCNSEIIVVYNWKQEEDKQADYLTNFYELRKKYPKLPDPFLLNCKLDEGIKAFKESLIGYILRNEGLKAKYREEWFNIKRKLEDEVSVGKQFIPYETYQEWCIAEHYENPESQRRLLHILDSVGSIVFFDRPILNQYQVLNPDWITTGAYSILVATQTKEKRGHLSWEDLKEIFKEEKEIFANKTIKIRYLEQNFHFLLELMLQYNLCERNPSNDKEFLIPSAFGERPSKDYKFAKDEARYYRLQFESPFEMLIMHRFIAKNIKKIESKDYWQSGIYIRHHDNKTFALVETNLFSKRIDCWIKGNNINGFWEIIQNDFKEIFEIYNDFPVQQLVKYNHPEKEVFLDYEEMLDALRNGKNIIDYDSKNRIKNIDVLAVLSLFEDKEKTLVKMKEQNNGDIHIHNEGTMNIGGVGNNSNNEQNIRNQPAIELIKEKEDLTIENKALKKWQQNSLWLMLISLIITSFIVLGIIEEVSWIASKEKWKTFKESDWFKWLGFIGAFAWNAFIGKMVYDRFHDPSKEKNFRDLFKVKNK